MMTVGIFNFYIGGSVNEAAALGLILIILGAFCLWLINRSRARAWGSLWVMRNSEFECGINIRCR